MDESLAYLNIAYLRDRETFNLSGGEKQKVALAGVLAMRPSILLLDEPLASLDPASAQETLAQVRKLADGGMTVVMVEHRVEDVLSIHPERVLFMQEGQVRYLGPVDGLRSAVNVHEVKLPAQVVIQKIKEETANSTNYANLPISNKTEDINSRNSSNSRLSIILHPLQQHLGFGKPFHGVGDALQVANDPGRIDQHRGGALDDQQGLFQSIAVVDRALRVRKHRKRQVQQPGVTARLIQAGAQDYQHFGVGSEKIGIVAAQLGHMRLALDSVVFTHEEQCHGFLPLELRQPCLTAGARRQTTA